VQISLKVNRKPYSADVEPLMLLADFLNTYLSPGDKATTEQAIAKAEVAIQQRICNWGMLHNALEPSGSSGHYDTDTGQYSLWRDTQIPPANRLLISQCSLGIQYNGLRVYVPHVAGGYGSMGYVYPTDPLVLFLAKGMSNTGALCRAMSQLSP
jgi:aerobic carbon-monoxide dehydrogenase large subunit